MAARFPQGTGTLGYKIKAAWASKIHAIYWAVGADTVQRLYSGDTSTTPITRSASGASFDSTNGFITGTNTTTYFTDGKSGGIGGLKENDNFVFGASYYGDCFSGGHSGNLWIGSQPPPDTFTSGFAIETNSYGPDWVVEGGGGGGRGSGFADDVVGWMTLVVRHNQADPTADIRVWGRTNADASGAEYTDEQSTVSPSSTDLIGSDTRPIYFGGTIAGTGNSSAQFECCFIAAVLSDADMVTLTTNPADVIEVSSGATITLTPDPASATTVDATKAITITRSSAASGNITYNLTSSNTGVATVPATAVILNTTTSINFNATIVGAGTTTITATNAADSGETDSVVLTVSALKGITITTGQTGLTGLTFAWFDEASPDLFGAPSVVGTTESTDGSGNLAITLTGTTLDVGETGWLLIYKAGATAPDDIAFFGRLDVEDIG
jgi:hypothetical protein